MEIQNINWNYPTPIWFGLNRSLEIASALKNLNITKPLVVTDPQFSENESFKKIMRNLSDASIQFSIFTNLKGNPTGQNVSDGVKVFNSDLNDGVIAIGGGSALDAGKAIALSTFRDPKSFWDLDMSNDIDPITNSEKFSPLICIPTTAGTGAEVEPGAIVTKTQTKQKLVIFHPMFSPSAAILDPELILSLPKNLTASTGIDALVHAIEAYSVPNFNPICDGIALQALRLMAPAIKQSYRNGADLSARGAMLAGSCMAAISFNKGLGLVHSISHMVGGLYDTPHGLTNAIILPAVLKYNKPKLEIKIKQIASACGAKTEDFNGLMEWIYELYDEFKIPKSLGAIGVRKQDIVKLTEMILDDICLPTNPRPITKASLETLLSKAIVKTW